MYAGWQALRRAREADIYGQVALVTGGSRGLGLLIAHELLEAGRQVAVCARDVTELEAAREQLERSGGQVMSIACDVSDPVGTWSSRSRRSSGPSLCW